MPDRSNLDGKGLCPNCGTKVFDGLRIPWGAVPGVEYEIGDDVKWVRDQAGKIVDPFTLHGIDQDHLQWNCGDPQYKNVIVFEWDNHDHYKIDCPNCHERIAGGAAVVRDGAFADILALREADVVQILGGSRGKANIIIVRDDGTFWPREDWYDHVVRFVGFSGKGRLDQKWSS